MKNKQGNNSDRIDFIVGEEKNLEDIISETEVAPLLKGMVEAGAFRAQLSDAAGQILWSHGDPRLTDTLSITLPLYLEGEITGKTVVDGPKDKEDYLKGLSGLFADAVQTILTNNLKRMLTTEIHTTVVNQSYEEVLETNRRLTISEGKYRELAKNLEKRVEERTDELKKAHAKFLQQEKMAAVGQLAAGMAHEINNPLGFIVSNLNTLNKYVARFKEMLDLYRSTVAEAGIDDVKQGMLSQKWKKLKLDFIMPDIDDLIGQSSEGCSRVEKIVADLKGFSHIDDAGETIVDLNREIDRTLRVLVHQIPEDASITKNYGTLSGFTCNAALICQMFLNIILNAVQVKPTGLRLTIDTKQDDDRITIRFTDNGPGISPEISNRIFEPFFTTKDVGAGTGMGLATAYEVVTSYGGNIEAGSNPEQGSEFIITLPVN